MIARLISLAAALMLLAACSSASDEALTGSGGSGGVGTGAGGGRRRVRDRRPDRARRRHGCRCWPRRRHGHQQDLEANVGDRIFFAVDSSVVDDAGRQTLDKQAAWLQQFPGVTVTIEGHCDESGTREYNLALGERRASAAKSYLVSLGVDPNRLLTISYGEERPVDPGHDEAAYAVNRRAVTVVNVTN